MYWASNGALRLVRHRQGEVVLQRVEALLGHTFGQVGDTHAGGVLGTRHDLVGAGRADQQEDVVLLPPSSCTCGHGLARVVAVVLEHDA